MEQATLNTLVAFVVIIFIGLLVWSRVQNQRIVDTVEEIKEILSNKPTEAVQDVRGLL